MKRKPSWQIFEKYSNVKFHESPSSGSRVVPCGQADWQTDMTNVILSFRNFVIVPNNVRNNKANVTVVKLIEVCWCLQTSRWDSSLPLVLCAVSYPNITGLQMLPVMRRATLGCCRPLLCWLIITIRSFVVSCPIASYSTIDNCCTLLK